jgi:hypothetical protein
VEITMHVNVFARFVAPCAAAAVALLSWAGPASAQGRGMMPMQGGMPMMPMSGGMPMMRPSMTMTNAQAAFLLAALRQREAFIAASLRQVDADSVALELRPASASRNALLTALGQRQIVLRAAGQQVAQQIAAVQR